MEVWVILVGVWGFNIFLSFLAVLFQMILGLLSVLNKPQASTSNFWENPGLSLFLNHCLNKPQLMELYLASYAFDLCSV